MAKNRVIYQSDALFTSKEVNSTGLSDHAQLRRIQSANYSFNITRQDINQFGQLARLEAVILESPTVSFDMSYYLGDGYNEQALNFKNSTGLDQGFISGQISSTSGNNFYILTSPEGVDVNSFVEGSGFSTIGIGNAFLTDYSLEASVGGIPTVSASFEGTNMNASAGVEAITGVGITGYSGLSGVGIDPSLGLPFRMRVQEFFFHEVLKGLAQVFLRLFAQEISNYLLQMRMATRLLILAAMVQHTFKASQCQSLLLEHRLIDSGLASHLLVLLISQSPQHLLFQQSFLIPKPVL